MRKGFGFHDRHSPFRFNPATMFSAGQPGAVYDFSDLTTLFQDSAGTTPVTGVEQVVGRMLDKSGNGNHATSTGAARPTLSARVNLLTYSEEFDQGAWTPNNVTITANTAVAPDGTTTADTLDDASASFGALSQIVSSLANSTYNFSVYIKSSGVASNVRIDLYTTVGEQFFAIFNSGTGAYVSGNGGIYTTTSVENGWYRVSLSASGSGNTTVRVYPAGGSAGATGSIYSWGADLRPANIGANVPAYQRIADANTYDTSGFPLYLRFDGTQSMSTGSIDFSGTDKMSVFAGVRKLSDAAQAAVAELSATIASNNGTFLLSAPNSAAANYNFSSKGTTQVDNTVTTYTAPHTAVLTGIADIAAPSNILRVNGAVAGTQTGSQGTGNFGNYALNIGARNNGASLPFNGRLYGLIVLGAQATDWQIWAAEQWMAQRTGISF